MRHTDGTYDLTIEDIHAIREKNYEMTKNMSIDERIEYINRRGKEVAEKLGLLNSNNVVFV